MSLSASVIVPATRIKRCNQMPFQLKRRFVLHWMTAFRRVGRNFAIQRAVELAQTAGLPLLVVEPLFIDEPWASARFHRFTLDGMLDNQMLCQASRVQYLPFIETKPGQANQLLHALSKHACAITTDDFPGISPQADARKLADEIDVRLEAIDSNGLVPLSEIPEVFHTAQSFRRFLQAELPRHLTQFPKTQPLLSPGGNATIPQAIINDFSLNRYSNLKAPIETKLDIDQTVEPVSLKGGAIAGHYRLRQFLKTGLPQYTDARMQPVANSTSGLSGYLHFGHLSAHDLVSGVLLQAGWNGAARNHKRSGSRSGWWGLSEHEEAFLDQIITWRELGFAYMHHRPQDAARYEGLPKWAKESLETHASDPRQYSYTLEDLQNARTHDDLWNAAQRQLIRDGVIHNYLRMLWGKRVLEWAPNPRSAVKWLIELNNRHAIDGRNPNSYSGIMWTFGRFDRPWGPKRPIFGTVRYMSSERTHKKMNLKPYLELFGG